MRQGAALAVLGLHVLGVGIGLRLGAWSDRHPPPSRQPALTVRLLRWAPPPEQPRPQAAAMPPANQPLKRSAPTEPQTPPDAARPPPSDTLQAITLPAEPGAPAGASAASAPPPPLNLALPRGASAPWRGGRNLALDDARSNSPKLTLEQKLAEAMGGSGPWVEEPIDADHRRLKRGNTCIYLQRPRAAQLDPFNPANRALPWQAGQPTRC
jgi:hypothetical protein